MSAKLYRIKLESEEREALEKIRSKGSHKAYKFKRSLVFLLADEGEHGPAQTDAQISLATGFNPHSISLLRKRCCEIGPLQAIENKPRETPSSRVKITGEVEAHITRLACSEAPEGNARWTLTLLANRLVELEIIETISRTSVASVLKKVNLNLGANNAGASRRNKVPPL